MYQTIGVLNAEHKVDIVQDSETKKILVKKTMSVYNKDVFITLKNTKISGIPKIYDISESNNELTVIEEYISGKRLSDILANNKPDLDTIQRYMTELCEILAHLHSMNPPVVHRDIKPANIIISPDGHVNLIDFNAAKIESEGERDTVLLGTKGYASPEQYGFGSSHPTSDVYSLGIILDEMMKTSDIDDPLLNRIVNKSTCMDASRRYKNAYLLGRAIKNKNAYSFVPPGFRTLNPWHMLIAIPIYIFLISVSLTIKIPNATLAIQLIDNAYLLIASLITVAILFNYLNIQNLFPPCRSSKHIIRLVGAVIFAFLFDFLFLLFITMIEAFWFS